jgi:excisionase family DNA binding protein
LDDVFAFTVADAVRYSGIGKSSLYDAIGAGRLDARKIGRKTLILAESLRSFIANAPAATVRTARRKPDAG